MKVYIKAKQFSIGQHLVDFIERKLAKLERFFDRIIDAEVFLSLDGGNSTVRDKVVCVKLNLPGQQVVVNETSKIFEEAIDSAIDSLSRQVKKYKNKMRR